MVESPAHLRAPMTQAQRPRGHNCINKKNYRTEHVSGQQLLEIMTIGVKAWSPEQVGEPVD